MSLAGCCALSVPVQFSPSIESIVRRILSGAPLKNRPAVVRRSDRIHTVPDERNGKEPLDNRGQLFPLYLRSLLFVGPEYEMLDIAGDQFFASKSNHEPVFRPWAPGSLLEMKRV